MSDECQHLNEFVIDFTSDAFGHPKPGVPVETAKDIAEVMGHLMHVKMRCKTCNVRMMSVGVKVDTLAEMHGVPEGLVKQAGISVSDDGYELTFPFGPAGSVVATCEGAGFTFAHLAWDTPTRTVQ